MAELYPAEDLYPAETLYPGEAPEEADASSIPAIAVLREYPPDELAVRIDPPKGGPSRWAADEASAENIAADMRLVDEMPGGDKEFTAVLARNPRYSFSDQLPFGDITVYVPGIEKVGNYRLDKAPESDGDRMSISPAALGHIAALDDDNALIGPGFIDSELGKWTDPSTERREQLLKSAIYLMASTGVGGSSLAAEANAPAIIDDFSNVTTAEGRDEAGEADYDSGGIDIDKVLYSFKDLSGGATNASWENTISLGTTDTSYSAAGTDHDATTASQQTVEAPGPGYRYARLRDRLVGSAAGTSLNRVFAWQYLKVLGRTGLALQGEWPTVGYTVAQMLAYAIPAYTYLKAEPEDLEDTGYIVQQAWYSDPGPLSHVVQDLTKYELLDYFVFGEKRFKLKRPGTYGRRWQAYSGPSGLEEQGLDGSRLWREILVSYQDVDGKTRTVGPPGSGATVESPGLELTDPNHPAVLAVNLYGPNFVRRDRLDLNGISTPARAQEAGELWLAEANQLSRSGSATLSGYAMDDRGIMRPVSQIRAGDEVRFPDAADTSYRKIVRRTYEHNSRSASLDLDAPPEGLRALLERMQADIKRLALS